MIKEIREPLIFEISGPGKRAGELPALDVPEKAGLLAGVPLRRELEGFPEVSETEITRHFTRLSQKNYCVDMGLYPLGSCTICLLYTSPSPRDRTRSRMPSSA